MRFSHAEEIWSDFPELAAGVIHARGIAPGADVGAAVTRFDAMAAARLGGGTESELPEIQAWRRAFSRMGLKPTQYRCASEALLRRFRKEGSLPRIHPLIDLCNAVSLAFAIPVAALDVSRIAWPLQVRRAEGSERYETFGGETEHPEPDEVVFADADGRAHARRWTNRQSGLSAVRDATCEVLIVAEALHGDAAADVARLVETLAGELRAHWGNEPVTAVLHRDAPVFEVKAAAG